MTTTAPTSSIPVIVADQNTPSRATTWREELSALAEQGCDLETLEGFIVDLLDDYREAIRPHRTFARQSEGPVRYSCQMGYNHAVDRVVQRNREVLEEYKQGGL
jgi:hypothetical protein